MHIILNLGKWNLGHFISNYHTKPQNIKTVWHYLFWQKENVFLSHILYISFTFLMDSFSSLVYCWWACVILSLPHNYRYSINWTLMCGTRLIWLVHWKPLMGTFQSLLLHVWGCRDLSSTLNVLISIYLPSFSDVSETWVWSLVGSSKRQCVHKAGNAERGRWDFRGCFW